MKIKCTCPCGAEFEAEGDVVNTGIRYREFLEAHAICREQKGVLVEHHHYHSSEEQPTRWWSGYSDNEKTLHDSGGCGKCK